MSEIVIPKGEVQEIAPGGHRLDLLEIRENAALIFTASTSIYTQKLVCHSGAKIVYRSSEIHDDAVFTLNILNAADTKDITLIGNGKHGTGFDPGQTAGHGKDGRNAKDPSFGDLDGRNAHTGSDGKPGADGTDGEDAVDFVLHFPNIGPGGEISVEAIGGNGGQGQDGGKGGRGGDKSRINSGRNGGNGGDGGDGGDSGDAGRITIFVVVPDNLFEDKVRSGEIIQTITINASTAKGEAGPGGSGGPGGRHGKANIGHNLLDGSPGKRGHDGAEGKGPTRGDAGKTHYVTVDVMSQSAFSQYIVQEMTVLSGR